MENNMMNSNKTLKVILGLVILALLAIAIYSYTLYKENAETTKELTQQKEQVLNDLSNMAVKYDKAIVENEMTNEQLVQARDRIKLLIDSVKKAENNVKSLWRYKKKYLALQDEMDFLLAQNDSLKIENAFLATTLDSTNVKLEEGKIFNDSLLTQNKELATIVKDASVLSVFGLKGYGIIERNSGKQIPTERAKRSDKLTVCFTVSKNKLVQSGDKMLYVQVIDPNDNVLGENIQVQFEAKTLNYSLLSKFNYENENLNICEYIKSKSKKGFDKGRYVVNVFNDAEMVSTSSFILK